MNKLYTYCTVISNCCRNTVTNNMAEFKYPLVLKKKLMKLPIIIFLHSVNLIFKRQLLAYQSSYSIGVKSSNTFEITCQKQFLCTFFVYLLEKYIIQNLNPDVDQFAIFSCNFGAILHQEKTFLRQLKTRWIGPFSIGSFIIDELIRPQPYIGIRFFLHLPGCTKYSTTLFYF